MKSSSRVVVLAVSIGLLSIACVSPLAKRGLTPFPAAPEVVRSPGLNSETEVEIGESMVSTARRIVTPGIRLTETVTHQGSNNGYPFVFTVPSGLFFVAGSDPAGTFYEAQHPLDFRLYTGNILKVRGGIFVPANPTEETEVYWIATNDGVTPLNDAHPGIEFEPTTVERWSDESFKRELVYGGVSQSTVTVLYREFMNDMARPAFSQELKYDLSKGGVIGFRGARFQVLDVTNTAIKFRALKHLD